MDALHEQPQTVQEVLLLLGATEAVLLEFAAGRNDDVVEVFQHGGQRTLARVDVQLTIKALLQNTKWKFGKYARLILLAKLTS